MSRAPRSWLLWAVAGAALVLIAFWVVPLGLRDAAAQAAPREVTPRGALVPGEQALIDLFEHTRVSVVYITTEARVVDLWTGNVFNVRRGTRFGFAWDERGHIVTNRHVVSGASGARVRLSDGRDVEAKLVGVSAAQDPLRRQRGFEVPVFRKTAPSYPATSVSQSKGLQSTVSRAY